MIAVIARITTHKTTDSDCFVVQELHLAKQINTRVPSLPQILSRKVPAVTYVHRSQGRFLISCVSVRKTAGIIAAWQDKEVAQAVQT